MENLSKTELIEKLKEAEEKINTYINNEGSDEAAKKLEILEKEFVKLVLKHGKTAFELFLTEMQLKEIKERNLWQRIFNL